MSNEFRQETSTPKASKIRVEGVWSANDQGDLVLTLVGGLYALRTGEMHASSTGKTATPVNLNVPRLYVTRDDGSEIEFRARMGIEHPLASATVAARF